MVVQNEIERYIMARTDTKLFNEKKERGLLYQCTDEAALKQMLESGNPVTLYEGTDPTADSLHIGHCVPFSILRRFQKAGHKVLILVGGATASIGDPSGKTELRKMLSKAEIDRNIKNIKKSLSVFLKFDGDNPAIVVNNDDWFKDINYIDFMRDVGVHFNVNKMLTSEIYKNRIEQGGLTFFEMGYQLMQAYDFVHLNKKYGCTLQYGGQDQWGNIAAGVELQRKLNFVNGTDINLVGATNPLLLTPDGKKMGKTERGAIWIDKNKISAYDFYQGLYQTPDECVKMMFALFTDLPMAEINALVKSDIVEAKKRMSYEITKFVRGEEDAELAKQMSENLFSEGGDDAPVYELEKARADGISILELLVMTGLSSSKGEARKLIANGGISVSGNKISDQNLVLKNKDFEGGSVLLKKGKKSFVKVVLV